MKLKMNLKLPKIQELGQLFGLLELIVGLQKLIFLNLKEIKLISLIHLEQKMMLKHAKQLCLMIGINLEFG